MATYQTRTERKEVPLGASCLQNIESINTHLVEDLGKLIYECNIDITLAVLYYFSGLCNFDGRCKVCTGSDHRSAGK